MGFWIEAGNRRAREWGWRGGYHCLYVWSEAEGCWKQTKELEICFHSSSSHILFFPGYLPFSFPFLITLPPAASTI